MLFLQTPGILIPLLRCTLENSDAGEIYIKTATGSVKGSLLPTKYLLHHQIQDG